MNTESIKKELISLVSTLFADNGFDVDMIEYADLVDDLGMDSILFVSLIVEIEFLFGITIPDDMLEQENFNTLEKIESVVLGLIKNEDDENAKQTNKNA